MNILCIQWEYEDDLPKMIQEEFDLLYAKSEIRDGVRMYPYVWTDDEHGEAHKSFLA